jgi:hypothetical protein
MAMAMERRDRTTKTMATDVDANDDNDTSLTTSDEGNDRQGRQS